MMPEFPLIPLLLRAGAVLAAQLMLYAALPFWALRFRVPTSHALTVSIAVGVALQGALGLVLGWVAVHPQRWGIWAYLAGLAVVRVFSRRIADHETEGPKPDGLLPALSAMAVAVRWIHPLETWALGQSDAYTHLLFIREILQGGRLSNPIYPPGYSWVMALPALAFGIDPYWIARFGGAFYGLGLILATHALAETWFGRCAGRITVGIVAGCPLLWPLLKTGVGAFANQAGLFAIPVVWLALARLHDRRGDRSAAATLVFIGLLLGCAVPMMLLQVACLTALVGLMGVFRSRRFLATACLAGFCLIPGVVLTGGHLAAAGGAARSQTPAYLSGDDVGAVVNQEEAPHELDWSSDQLVRLAADFFRIKRMGFGDWLPDLLAAGAGGIFTLILARGLLARSFIETVLGAWGGLTLIQTWTGFMQFTAYQREGWSLLLACAMVAGYLVRQMEGLKPVLIGHPRWCSAAALLLAASGLVLPPTHTVFGSAAEHEIVAFARAVGGDPIARSGWRDLATLWAEIDRSPNIMMVCRRISGFGNDIGDPLFAFSSPRIRVVRQIDGPPGDGLLLALLDETTAPPDLGGSIMRRLQPELVESFEQNRARAAEENNRLERSLRRWGAPLEDLALSPRLRVLVWRPENGEG
ncbi:MAG: hypothetical protein NZ740_03165 [Kiritimatiellae bacterium]|nr:hypothetical protein [Kiritimatiellia bacterium]MDW8458092.1 hypothetical protein [Verrucomicrobiota bacterium]